MGRRACPCAGGMGGQDCSEPTLGGCTDHRWALMPCVLVSLPLTCLEVSVSACQPLTMADPSIPLLGVVVGGSCMLPAGPGSAGQRVPCAWASPDRRPHCMARGQPAAARRRAVPGLSQGATVAGAGAEPCPVTPSWRQRWTWPSGAASARPSGSCSGRSWSGTRKRWHPSVFARSVAVTDRTTRRTGLGESGLGLGSHAPPAFAPGDGSFEAQPCCGLDRFGFVRGWEQPGTEQLGA